MSKLGDDHPQTLTTLHIKAAVLQAHGRRSDAEPHYRKALQKSCLKLGNHHPNTMMTMCYLTHLLKSMNKSDEADELFSEHLEGCRQKCHRELVSWENLKKLLEECGLVDEADELYRFLAGCQSFDSSGTSSPCSSSSSSST